MDTITYFEKPGKQNTQTAFQIARDYALRHGVKDIVLASTTGSTAILAADFFGTDALRLTVVGVDTYGWSQDAQRRKELEEKGITAIPCTEYLSQEAANALRWFSQGTKVAFEIAFMAAKAGAVPAEGEVISIGGTGFGSDTVLVLKFAESNGKREFGLSRILCLPGKVFFEKPGEKVF